MKRTSTFFILLFHMSFTVLLPTALREHSDYTFGGVILEESKSVYDYVDSVLLGERDSTPKDENEKRPLFCQMAMAGSFYYPKNKIVFTSKISHVKLLYPRFYQPGSPTLSYDIIAPPPEA
jgi:hypothetical protein